MEPSTDRITVLPHVVKVDFNSAQFRLDGKYEVSATSRDCLRLRWEVVLEQDDVQIPGIVCGIMDYGRETFYMFEYDFSRDLT